jgi:beta-lactamase regulating signal transducer with metallopeptidase domain
MNRPSEILILTLVHSLWQGGIIYLCSYLFHPLLRNFTPLIKRNFLLGLLALQVIISIQTAWQLSGMNTGWLLSFETIPVNHRILRAVTDLLMILYIYLAGVRLIKLFYQYSGISNQLGYALQKAPIDIRLFTAARGYDMGIKRKVAVFISAHITSPLTYGLLKPVILLPVSLVTGLSREQTEAIILHELTHIKNMDYLVNGLLLITESLYFFNPFVRSMSNAIRLEQEKECDLQAINHKIEPLMYAETLVALASSAAIPKSRASHFTAGECQLFQRVHFITQKNHHKLIEKRTVLLLLLPVLVMMTWMTPGNKSTQSIKSGQPIKELTARRIFMPAVSPWTKTVGNPIAAGSTTISQRKQSVKKNLEQKTIMEPEKSVSTAEDLNMLPMQVPGFATTLASSAEPSDQKQVTIREELSGGRTIYYFFTLNRYSEKWDYHLDSIRIEKSYPADSTGLMIDENAQ